MHAIYSSRFVILVFSAFALMLALGGCDSALKLTTDEWIPAPSAPNGGPMFAVSALADPGTDSRAGGKLQQLQVIKGWVDAEGLFHQKVIVVAGNPENQADVNPATCAPRGEGAQSLCGVWQDSEFDPNADSVYYARVLENPSCRWSAQLCLDLAESNPDAPLPDGCSADALPHTIQERAWTSPIQYVVPSNSRAL